MRIQVLVGKLESGEVEAIACGSNLPAQEAKLAKLVGAGGIESQRKRYVQIEVLTNDHIKRRIAFAARPEKLAENAEAGKARVAADQLAIDEKKAADAKAAAEKAAQELADLDAKNMAARYSIIGKPAVVAPVAAEPVPAEPAEPAEAAAPEVQASAESEKPAAKKTGGATAR